jgi:GxxExxY protein
MDTNEHESKLIHGDLVYSIVGCAMEVLNQLGHGLNEKPDENAIVLELGLKDLPFDQQTRFNVVSKGTVVGEYIPDLIVAKSVVVDTKTIDKITDHERGQMMNYLRITKLRVGIILNFKQPKLEWERIVL